MTIDLKENAQRVTYIDIDEEQHETRPMVLLEDALAAVEEARQDAMPTSIPYKPWLLQRLQAPEALTGYLEAALEEDDLPTMKRVVQDCIQAINFAASRPAPEGEGRRIVCIIGSSRFVDHMSVYGWELEKQGWLVLGLHLLPQWYPNVQPDHQAEAEGVTEVLDAVHLDKIRMAHRVLVFNKDGYIGDRTRVEIAFAESLGKPIDYLVTL